MDKDEIRSKTAFAKAQKNTSQPHTLQNQEFPKKETEKIAIAFYNVENLFDTANDPHTLDDDFTPEGKRRWTSHKYNKKVKKIAQAIALIGATKTGTTPSLVGLAEVENAKVIKDLLASEDLNRHSYGFVHRESPDERGIDVALLYKKADFTVSHVKTHTLYIESRPGVRDRTRDILEVKGILKGKEVSLLINHWPSKGPGEKQTEHKRVSAAQKNREVINTIRKISHEARIILMGDFNDGPQDKSVREHLVQTDFYNPMVFLATRYQGSLNHGWRWYTYDQIMFTNNFMQLHSNSLRYDSSGIFNDTFLSQYKGKFEGHPFRSYGGNDYLGGYSDHFPVYCILHSE